MSRRYRMYLTNCKPTLVSPVNFSRRPVAAAAQSRPCHSPLAVSSEPRAYR